MRILSSRGYCVISYGNLVKSDKNGATLRRCNDRILVFSYYRRYAISSVSERERERERGRDGERNNEEKARWLVSFVAECGANIIDDV